MGLPAQQLRVHARRNLRTCWLGWILADANAAIPGSAHDPFQNRRSLPGRDLPPYGRALTFERRIRRQPSRRIARDIAPFFSCNFSLTARIIVEQISDRACRSKGGRMISRSIVRGSVYIFRALFVVLGLGFSAH